MNRFMQACTELSGQTDRVFCSDLAATGGVEDLDGSLLAVAAVTVLGLAALGGHRLMYGRWLP